MSANSSPKVQPVGMFSYSPKSAQGGRSGRVQASSLLRPVGPLGLGIGKKRAVGKAVSWEKEIQREVMRASDIYPQDWSYGLWLYKGLIYQVDPGATKERERPLVMEAAENLRLKAAEGHAPAQGALDHVGYFDGEGETHIPDMLRRHFPPSAFRRDAELDLPRVIPVKLVSASEEEPVEWEHGVWLFQGFMCLHAYGQYTRGQVKFLVTQRSVADRKLFGNVGRKHGRNEQIPDLDNMSREQSSRLPIPKAVRIEVWRRDGGKCAVCGSRERLEFDHIVPVSKGGSNTARNIELLCEKHNRSKGSNIA